IRETVEAQTIVQASEQRDVVLEPDVGAAPAARHAPRRSGAATHVLVDRRAGVASRCVRPGCAGVPQRCLWPGGPGGRAGCLLSVCATMLCDVPISGALTGPRGLPGLLADIASAWSCELPPSGIGRSAIRFARSRMARSAKALGHV